jgi:hypothetical protein
MYFHIKKLCRIILTLAENAKINKRIRHCSRIHFCRKHFLFYCRIHMDSFGRISDIIMHVVFTIFIVPAGDVKDEEFQNEDPEDDDPQVNVEVDNESLVKAILPLLKRTLIQRRKTTFYPDLRNFLFIVPLFNIPFIFLFIDSIFINLP